MDSPPLRTVFSRAGNDFNSSTPFASYAVLMPTDQEPTQADAKKEPDVKYVLSGQPTGWWAAAKDVREFDVEKVQSCKEDIDTLLVFVSRHFPL